MEEGVVTVVVDKYGGARVALGCRCAGHLGNEARGGRNKLVSGDDFAGMCGSFDFLSSFGCWFVAPFATCGSAV